MYIGIGGYVGWHIVMFKMLPVIFIRYLHAVCMDMCMYGYVYVCTYGYVCAFTYVRTYTVEPLY